MLNPVIIFGAGNTGKLAMDIFQSNGVVVYGFLDDRKEIQQSLIGEIPVLGQLEDDKFLKLIGKKCDAFIAAENSKERKYLFEMLKDSRSVAAANAIHAHASISPHAEIGHGNLFAAGSRVSPFSTIGSGCILQGNVVISPSAKLGDHVIIGAGSCIGSDVVIESGAFIGIGVSIPEGFKVGKNASVGAGSVLVSDVPANARFFGYPAQEVK